MQKRESVVFPDGQLKMSGMIDPQIFEHLKAKIDEESQAKDELNQIVQGLERHVSYTQGLLSRIHSTPRSSYSSLLPQVEASIKNEIEDMAALSNAASKHPYYKCALVPSYLARHHQSDLSPWLGTTPSGQEWFKMLS